MQFREASIFAISSDFASPVGIINTLLEVLKIDCSNDTNGKELDVNTSERLLGRIYFTTFSFALPLPNNKTHGYVNAVSKTRNWETSKIDLILLSLIMNFLHPSP